MFPINLLQRTDDQIVPRSQSINLQTVLEDNVIYIEYCGFIAVNLINNRKLPQKVRKGKPTFKLVDEDDEDQQETIPHEEGNDPDLELAMKLSLETPQEKGEGEGDDADLERAIKLSLDPALLPQGRAPVGGVTIREPGSEATTRNGMNSMEGKAIVTEEQGVSIPGSDPEKAHEAQAGPDPEPMQEDQTGSDSGKLHVSLAGPNPEHMDDEFIATAYPKVHENLKLITGERVLNDKPESHSGSMSSLKNLDDTVNFGDQFLHDQPTEDDQEKSKAREESDSNIPDPSHQTVTSTPPVIPPFAEISSSMPSLLITPPPINTEATTITTSLPEIHYHSHSSPSAKSTRWSKRSLKVVKNQESEKTPKEIIKAKKEQDEEKQDSTYSIRSTDKVDLEEFDLKSALFSHMNKKKSANKNTTNYRLYHALMEALIADEDAMDKEVADQVKDHKRKHDSDDDEDDDDDEGPSAGSNQGRSTKKRRSDFCSICGQLNLLRKMMTKFTEAKGSLRHLLPKQHPSFTQLDEQITDNNRYERPLRIHQIRIPIKNILNNHQYLTSQSKIKGWIMTWRTSDHSSHSQGVNPLTV
ncbi:hypothetical protein Tco_0935043 [Tanacetum coccineum]